MISWASFEEKEQKHFSSCPWWKSFSRVHSTSSRLCSRQCRISLDFLRLVVGSCCINGNLSSKLPVIQMIPSSTENVQFLFSERTNIERSSNANGTRTILIPFFISPPCRIPLKVSSGSWPCFICPSSDRIDHRLTVEKPISRSPSPCPPLGASACIDCPMSPTNRSVAIVTTTSAIELDNF